MGKLTNARLRFIVRQIIKDKQVAVVPSELKSIFMTMCRYGMLTPTLSGSSPIKRSYKYLASVAKTEGWKPALYCSIADPSGSSRIVLCLN